MPVAVYWLACLIAAHILADFPLQTKRLIKNKRKFRGLLLHGMIHGLVSYLLCAQWSMWYLPLVVTVVHSTVDYIKRNRWPFFILDQLLHVVTLVILVLVLPFDDSLSINTFRSIYFRALVLMSGLVVVTMGSGIFIGNIMHLHMKRNNLKLSGLAYGGYWIGFLERLMIFILILFNMSAGIGFLIAAKSILRFSETKDDQKMAEYVLIGTLLSFSASIPLAILTKYAVYMVTI